MVSPYLVKERCAGETPLPLSARPWCDALATASRFKPAPRVSRGAGAGCSLSPGRRRSTRACCARTPCCAGLGLRTTYQRALGRREASLLRRAAVVQHASYGLRCQASAACHTAQARQRSLSLGKRRSTRACFARARCRTGCGRLRPRSKAAHRREGSLLRCNTVVQRASCGLKLQASTACLVRHRRAGARCLW